MKYFIEIYEDWSDYPSWENLCDYSDTDEPPLTFDTEQDALDFVHRLIQDEYDLAVSRHNVAVARYLPAQELFEKRVEVLTKAGLGKQSNESFIPLIGVCKPGPPPEWDMIACKYKITLKDETDEYA